MIDAVILNVCNFPDNSDDFVLCISPDKRLNSDAEAMMFITSTDQSVRNSLINYTNDFIKSVEKDDSYYFTENYFQLYRSEVTEQFEIFNMFGNVIKYELTLDDFDYEVNTDCFSNREVTVPVLHVKSLLARILNTTEEEICL